MMWTDRRRKSSAKSEIEQKLAVPNSQRLFFLRYALLSGMSTKEIHDLTHIDPWFLYQLQDSLDP